MDHKNDALAPVALFVYNRLENTRQVIEALKNNDLAPRSDLFIFSDAAKTNREEPAVARVREYLRTIDGFRSVTIVERPENFYIEKNIIEGVTELINRFGKIIVLEDDGVTSENFLTFMNDALDFYEHEERVMHIASFTFIKMPKGFNKTFFWRYSENTGGGWATWKHAWDKFVWFQSEVEGLQGLTEEYKRAIELDGAFPCLQNLKLSPIPWDICWYIAIVKNGGLAVNSPWALIKNIGLFNGTHFTVLNRLAGRNPFDVELRDYEEAIVFDALPIENDYAISRLKEFYQAIGTSRRERVVSSIMKVLVMLRITKLAKRLLK